MAMAASRKASQAAWYQRNSAWIKAERSARWRSDPTVKANDKACRDRNREKIRARDRARAKRDREKKKLIIERWHRNNPERSKALARSTRASRIARKKSATPPWLTREMREEINAIYAAAVKEGLEVDHIIPLGGKDVCGLHVPWNLQKLDWLANRKKGNRHGAESD